MAARKPSAGAKAPTEAVKTPAPLVGEGWGEGAKTTVSISVKKPHARRWRAGLCFTQQPRVESVTDEVLALLQADPLLVVEDVSSTPPSQPSPMQGEGAKAPSPLVGEGRGEGEKAKP